MQQYLPFTVLKLLKLSNLVTLIFSCNSTYRLRYWNACSCWIMVSGTSVATVLTVYGIETHLKRLVSGETSYCCNSTYRLRYWNCSLALASIVSFNTLLQQYLPFTVLKPYPVIFFLDNVFELQQYLPFTVLKLACSSTCFNTNNPSCCNSTYRLRYWNHNQVFIYRSTIIDGCNSTYRLRYWNFCNWRV